MMDTSRRNGIRRIATALLALAAALAAPWWVALPLSVLPMFRYRLFAEGVVALSFRDAFFGPLYAAGPVPITTALLGALFFGGIEFMRGRVRSSGSMSI